LCCSQVFCHSDEKLSFSGVGFISLKYLFVVTEPEQESTKWWEPYNFINDASLFHAVISKDFICQHNQIKKVHKMGNMFGRDKGAS
jgi:hypothetical protein